MSLGLKSAGSVLALSAALWLSVAGAQACPQREVEIEQPGLGVVRANALEFEGDVALLEGACFGLGGLSFDAVRARADETGVRAEGVQIRGVGVSGTAATATTQGEEARLSDLALSLALPSTSLPGFPLPPGRYTLRANEAEAAPAGRFRFGDATLARDGTTETYRLVNAELWGQRLRAERADLVRLSAQNVRAQPNLIRTGPSEIGLCRAPEARELSVRAASLTATASGTVLGDARLQLFGLGLPVGTLTLPVSAGGNTLGESVTGLLGGATAFGERFGRAAPQLVLGGGRFGVRDVPSFDEQNTRLNVVLHPQYLEFGVRTTLDGAEVALGIFQDPDSDGEDPRESDRPVPQFTVGRQPQAGLQTVLAFRGGNELTESRLGYAWLRPVNVGFVSASARLLLEGGAAYQGGLSDAYVRAQGRLNASARSGAFGVDARAILDAERFVSGAQTSLELAARVSVTRESVSVSAEQLERQVWGRALLPDFRVDPARTTTFAVGLEPNLAAGALALRRLGYAYSYDWLQHQPTQNELSATLAVRIGGADLVPTLSYDWAKARLATSTEVTLYSQCFAYGVIVTAYHEPQRGGVGLRLKFNLR